MSRESLMTQTFVELADTLVDEFDVVELLNLLTRRCTEVLEVDGAAGLMMQGPDGLRVMASTSEATRVLELFELQSQEGPCLDCFHTGEPVVNHDLEQAHDRWPEFAPVALAAGFRFVHAFPMRLRGSRIGTLNLFQIRPGDMNPDDVRAAQAFADVATIGILQYRHAVEAQGVNDQLSRALDGRAIVEQAKGVMAEREGLNMTEAHLALRGYATRNSLPLGDVCREVVERTLPTWTLLATFQEGQDSSA